MLLDPQLGSRLARNSYQSYKLCHLWWSTYFFLVWPMVQWETNLHILHTPCYLQLQVNAGTKVAALLSPTIWSLSSSDFHNMSIKSKILNLLTLSTWWMLSYKMTLVPNLFELRIYRITSDIEAHTPRNELLVYDINFVFLGIHVITD